MSEERIGLYYGRIYKKLSDDGPMSLSRLYAATVVADTVAQFDYWHRALCKLTSERKVIYRNETYQVSQRG